MAGVTRATIGNIVSDLLDAGLIEEREPRLSTGRVGKPGRPLWFGPRTGLTAAVALEAGSVEAALVNARGEILQQSAARFDQNDASGDSAIEAAASTLSEVITPDESSEVLGIGIAVPGVCDTATGNVLGSGQIPGLGGTALVDRLSERFGFRVLIDNDSRAQALGEKWFGAGKGLPTFASIQTGHGIGVGLVIGGTVLRGAHGEAGEAGHMRVVEDGAECRCGLRGCWETIATLQWLREQATGCEIPGSAELDARSLVSLAQERNEQASDLLDRYASNLSVGIANLTQILGLGVFIVHGDVVGGGETLRTAIAREVRSRILGHMQAEIVLSDLDRRAGLLGAAGLVLSETFHLSI